MTAQNLIQDMQKAILKWYPFDEEKKKIIVDDSNIEKIAELNIEADYVIVTQAIEKISAPEQILSDIREKMKPDGRLFVLMNNRLGLRYFCGDKDPYTKSVIDCLENYHDLMGSNVAGKMYDKSQMKAILKKAGLSCFQFFSVYTDLDNPSCLFSEDYIPNEDLTNRIIPSYNFPQTVFMEESLMYQQLIDNSMFHQMANAYLVECALDGRLCEVSHVTSSLERGREDALFTIIYKSGIVEKKAAYPEGKKRIIEIDRNSKMLKANGISIVEGWLSDDSYQMNYVQEEMSQLYFERLLRDDIAMFLKEMDHFRDIILRSSEIISTDKGDGEGAILKYGFFDMVPLNCFHVNEDFMFFDQEFCEKNYPANVLIWRLVASFYAADIFAEQIYPKVNLLERYDLKRNLEKWKNTEWDFLKALRKENILEPYHKKIRANKATIWENKKRMNESARDYEKKYLDIFENINEKKLILFGMGQYAKKFIELYGMDFPIYAILDNHCEEKDQKMDGIRIAKPDYLATLTKDSFQIIICMKEYHEVAKQLEDMGINAYSIFDPNKYYQTRPRTSIQIVKGADIKEEKKYHIGYVAGAFDMFHIGHLNLLRRAKKQCEYLIVGIISDEKMFRLKNKYPIIPSHERMAIVAGCRYADQVEELPLDRAGIRDAYHLFHFDCMFSGDDHSENKGWLDDKAYLQEQGADLVFLPYTKETSSTEIRNMIKKN